MEIITTTLTTTAHYSEDGQKRYLLQKVWDDSKPSLAIIMLAPGSASEVSLDSTSMLVLNNADRLGYGSVAILNLFATLNDYSLKQAEEEDMENTEAILQTVQAADAVVYAPGTGKAANKLFQQRQKDVLTALVPFQDKLYCLSGEKGKGKLSHPLAPVVRIWNLLPFKPTDLLGVDELPVTEPQKKTGKKPQRKLPNQNKTPCL